jgi:hypothetical protein
MSGERLLRLVLVLAGCFSITWGIVTLPSSWRNLAVEQVSGEILRGVAYTPQSLSVLQPTIDGLENEDGDCEPRALHAAAVISLHLMEQGYVPDQVATLDRRIDAASNAIRRSLGCAPADPFLWMVLYSIETARNGFKPEYLEFIRQSYRLGPHEGWIAVKRNRVVIGIFGLLPPDLAQMALSEFAELVQNRLYEQALDIILGPGWPIHDRLIARLASIAERERTEFAVRLYTLGVGLAVPGVEPPGQRPWR